MKKYWQFISILWLVACSGPEEKVIDIHDVLPSAKGSVKDTLAQTSDENEDLIAMFRMAFPELKSIENSSKKHFIDRFGADTNFQYKLISEMDSLNYREWYFSDSVKTSNAFYNWLDFAAHGESVYIGKPVKLNDQSFEMFVNDSLIVMIEGRTVDFKKWVDYMKENDIVNWKYILQQGTRGKVKWFLMEEGKLEQL